MSDELLVAYAWTYQRIVNDPTMQVMFTNRGLDITNQVWEFKAPEGVQPPFIVYQRIGGGDVRALGGARVYSMVRELIRVVDVGQDWGHDDIVGRLNQLFGLVINVAVSDPPGYIEACSRAEPFDQPEDVGGVQWRHLGGIFEIAAQAA